MKWIYILLIGTLLMCGSGIVSAANETGNTLTLFNDEDTIAAQKTIDDSGIGYMFALMDLIGKYLIIVVIFTLLIMGMIYRAFNNSEKYKGALAAILYIIGILLVVQVAYSVITSMIPDISIIQL